MDFSSLFTDESPNLKHSIDLELSNLYELVLDEKELIKNKALLQEKWSNYEYIEDWIGV